MSFIKYYLGGSQEDWDQIVKYLHGVTFRLKLPRGVAAWFVYRTLALLEDAERGEPGFVNRTAEALRTGGDWKAREILRIVVLSGLDQVGWRTDLRSGRIDIQAFDPQDPDAEIPEVSAWKREMIAKVREVVDHFPEADREIIRAWMTDKTFREIADEVDLKKSRVCERFHEALRRLKDLLKDFDDSDSECQKVG